MSDPYKQLIEAARTVLKAGGYFADHLWHVDDIHFICEQLELPPLGHDEAMEIFTFAHGQFDGGASLSWPQLEQALRLFLQRRALAAASHENEAYKMRHIKKAGK